MNKDINDNIKKNIRGIVISGGGSKGAFAGGIAQYLIEDMEREYDLFLGTSTGGLITPLLASKDIDQLREAYTNVSQDDIFTVNPFKIKQNKNGVTKIDMNHFKIFWNIVVRKQKSFGDSSGLRNNLIPKFFTKEMYKNLLASDKEVICCVVNATLGTKEYKSTNNYEYEDYLDWMYASACAPPFMSLVEKDNYEYTDGGIMEHVPIQRAIEKGAKEIDVIILRPEDGNYRVEKVRNTFHWLIKIDELRQAALSDKQFQLNKLRALTASPEGDVKLNIYYTPRRLTNNSLIFDKGTMLNWWVEGYEHAKLLNYKSYTISKGKKPKLISSPPDIISHN